MKRSEPIENVTIEIVARIKKTSHYQDSLMAVHEIKRGGRMSLDDILGHIETSLPAMRHEVSARLEEWLKGEEMKEPDKLQELKG